MKAPIKDFNLDNYPNGCVTQWFGENPVLYGTLDLDGHNGIDIVAPHGEPMYATESGTVVDVKDTPDGYGRHLRFITNGTNCRVWTYGHCSKIHVKQGDKIQEGDHIADMGNTGFVVSGHTPFWEYNPYAGTHLHIGYRNVTRDPSGWHYIGNNIRMKVKNLDNGYKGNVDPKALLATVSDDTANRARLLTIISLLRKVVDLYKQLNELK